MFVLIACGCDNIVLPLPKLCNRREFGKEIKFVVAKKADSLYKTVSAASIVAKVSYLNCRDGMVWYGILVFLGGRRMDQQAL